MECARELLSRPLPNLAKTNYATENRSIHTQPVSVVFWRPWENFHAQVKSAYNTLDLDKHLSLAHPTEPELYLVGNKLGLVSRLNANLFTLVARALNTTHMRGLVFGDMDAVCPDLPSRPDVMLYRLQNDTAEMIAPGQVKTGWTIDLSLLEGNAPPARLARLERVIGQAIGYMLNNLRHTFLTTYLWTVFIKRTGDYQFKMSPLIAHNATKPSLRECFAGFAALAGTNPSYYPDPGFDPFRLFVSGVPGFRASDHFSLSRDAHSRPPSHADEHVTVVQRKPVIGDLNLGGESIFIGSDSVIVTAVTCVRVIRQGPRKMIAEVQWIDGRGLAKCWPPEYYESYSNERNFYLAMKSRHPKGHEVFPALYGYGEIITSAIFPDGYVLLLSYIEGTTLSRAWPSLGADERIIVRDQCQRAVGSIRSLGIYLQNAGKYNVLYNSTTRRTTLIDFEHYGHATEHHRTLDAPEMFDIFGDEEVSVS